ncbi:phosphatidylserine decarboxylase proenzyme 2 [Favolaschia claudopus]|uniref:Phosphatidylserine decarboxylase proenzyme 2 n=1 Tax=Favolaschia claudopus TaxID=2862362 RepID=A0AAV9ZG57_9AGAR
MTTPAPNNKKRKLRRALKLPFNGRATGSGGRLAPRAGEQPIIFLRVQVLGGNGLIAKDRNGFSDPFVVASLLSTRHQTPVAKKTLNPIYAAKDSTWDFPIYPSLMDKLGVVELVVWDKDVLRKDYLGEAGVAVEDWFVEGRAKGWEGEGNLPFHIPLVSSRPGTPAQGSLQLRLGFVAPPPPPNAPNQAQVDFDAVYRGLVKTSRGSGRRSLVAVPPTEGVGTIRSTTSPLNRNASTTTFAEFAAGFDDDGGLSSDSSESEGEGEGEGEGESGEEDEEGEEEEGLEECEEDEENEAAAAVSQTPAISVIPGSPATEFDPDVDARTPTGPSPLTTPTPSSAGAGAAATTPTPNTTTTAPAPTRPANDKKRPSFIALPLPKKFLPSRSRSRPTTPGAAGMSGGETGGKEKETKETKEKKKGFRRSWHGNASAGGAGEGGDKDQAKEKSKEKEQEKAPTEPKKRGGRRPKPQRAYSLGGDVGPPIGSRRQAEVERARENDIVGIVMLEIAGAEDLPRLKNSGWFLFLVLLPRFVSSSRRRFVFVSSRLRCLRPFGTRLVSFPFFSTRFVGMTRTSFDMDPFVVISFGKKVFRTRVIRHSLNPVWDEKLLFHVRRYEIGYEARLTVLDWDKLSSNDYIGECAFNVSDLVADAPQPLPPSPPSTSSQGGLTATSPSVPAFNVEEGEDADATARERGTRIPLYAETEAGDHPMKEFKLKLEIGAGQVGMKEPLWESKHKPMITFRAKYQPYSLLRQRFWRQYLMQYDTDDTKTISHVEMTSMLDSLGSTLTGSTVDSFFTRFGKDPRTDDLTFEEAIRCLETEVLRPQSERRRVDEDSPGTGVSVSASPAPGGAGAGAEGELKLGEMDFAGPGLDVDFSGEGKGYTTEPAEMVLLSPSTTPGSEHSRQTTTSGSSSDVDLEEESPVSSSMEASGSSNVASTSTSTSSSNLTSSAVTTPSASSTASTPPAAPAGTSGSAAAPSKKSRFRRPRYRKTQDSTVSASQIASVSQASSGSPGSEESFERVINVKNCPLCHRPRLNSKAEIDIITHIAVCASKDWNIVDRIVVGNFVTASQAQRKFFTRILGKISSGNYKLGANSANIIVQNRMTGQLEEEKMQVYVRLGIRLLYKGMKSRMEGGRARRLLKSLSIKQGIKYDSTESAQDIPGFIEFHGLKVDEIQDPLDSFKTFNQFFYRKLKPSARPVEKPDDPYRLVSAADCRFMAFESVSEATRLWIKGREFTVARLLGDAYKHEAERYTGGALAIFRLAPQDYHRFHSPVEGTIGNMTYIAGEYYTVNPQAIRTALDVYGENARKIVPIDSPQFGRVMAVCVGAMMVGSIETTVKEGESVKRGQEFGYFAFGGSTIVLLFEKDMVEWDEDLLVNGRASLETLVRVGMGIGAGKKKSGR